MHYDFVTIPDAEIPRAAEPVFQHLLTTYASEANKTSIGSRMPRGCIESARRSRPPATVSSALGGIT